MGDLFSLFLGNCGWVGRAAAFGSLRQRGIFSVAEALSVAETLEATGFLRAVSDCRWALLAGFKVPTTYLPVVE